MKKLSLLFIAVVGVLQMTFAGGIVTNTNQSCSWIRMPVRDAAVGVDATFYNPAGLTKLADGFHLQINNQTIKQKRQIENDYNLLNNHTYIGDVYVPSLPTAFAVYKKDRFAISAGFTIIGGGGSADYAQGLPSIETTFAQLKMSLAALGASATPAKDFGITGYSSNINFNGSSVYYGIQVGGSFKVNDKISIAAGVRYVMARNSYKGAVKDILLYRATGSVRADAFIASDVNPFIDAQKARADAAIAGTTQLLTALATAPDVPLTALGASGTAVIGGLIQMGVPSTTANAMTVGQAKSTLTSIKTTATTGSATLAAAKTQLAGVKDMEVDVLQEGNGFCPIINANFSLMDDKLNVSVKYEDVTKMKVKNKTTQDGTGTMFPDGKKIGSDIPAMLSIGVRYNALSNFSINAGMHYYFDKNFGTDYGKEAKVIENGVSVIKTGNEYFIDKNSYEAALGIEFNLNDKLALSAGYLYASTSPALAYQTDMSYSLVSHTIGFGGSYVVSSRFNLELGILYTSYQKGEKEFDYGLYGKAKETYYKDNVVGSIGVTYRFGGK